MKSERLHILGCVLFLLLDCTLATACGEHAALTNYQPLALVLSTDKEHYWAGEQLKFTLHVVNTSQDSIRCPTDFRGELLPSTEQPDGKCVNYRCTEPAPDCVGRTYGKSIVLGPGDETEYQFQRTVFFSGDPGLYIWQYTLFLFNCSDIPHTHRIVARTNEVEIVFDAD